MSRFRVYLKTWNSTGTALEDNETEITDYIDYNGIATISESSDSSPFDVGVFKYSHLKFKLNNVDGIFSNVGTSRSIFKYTRRNSRFRITWDLNDDGPICGIAICGNAFLSEEIDLFWGLLNDDATTMDLRDNFINFQARGMDSLLDNYLVPDTFNPGFNAFITVLADIFSEASASLGVFLTGIISDIPAATQAIAIDDPTQLRGLTIKAALDRLLLIGNLSLSAFRDYLYVFVNEFQAGDTQVKTFYGQGSELGIEDIISISNIKEGLNKTFNTWIWKSTSTNSVDSSSVSLYGAREKELDDSMITTTGTREDILDLLLAQYKLPNQEFDLTVPLTYPNMELKVLDLIGIDYPTVYRARTGGNVPIYGVAKYGTAVYPDGDFSFEINPTDNYKIFSRKINTKNQTVTFKVRKV